MDFHPEVDLPCRNLQHADSSLCRSCSPDQLSGFRVRGVQHPKRAYCHPPSVPSRQGLTASRRLHPLVGTVYVSVARV